MNLNTLDTYRLEVLTSIDRAIVDNDPQMVDEAFRMYKDCMVLALEHGHLGVSTRLSADMYQAIRYSTLIERHAKGSIAPEVFTKIIGYMPPDYSDIRVVHGTDAIHTELLEQFLRQTCETPERLMHLTHKYCRHEFPEAFCLSLKSVLEHPERDSLTKLPSGRSIITMLRQYITPDYIYVDGEMQDTPKGTFRQLPNKAVKLLRKHHGFLAAVHKYLGSYEPKDSLPMEVVEQFARGLPLESLKTFGAHHQTHADDPRAICRAHALGYHFEPAEIKSYFLKAGVCEDNSFGAQSWKRCLCWLIENTTVDVAEFSTLINAVDAYYGRGGAMLSCVESSLDYLAKTPSSANQHAMDKIEQVCLHLLDLKGDQSWLRSGLLKIAHLPKTIAHHPSLVTECLERDLGL
jgi:hypothetical protein